MEIASRGVIFRIPPPALVVGNRAAENAKSFHARRAPLRKIARVAFLFLRLRGFFFFFFSSKAEDKFSVKKAKGSKIYLLRNPSPNVHIQSRNLGIRQLYSYIVIKDNVV